MPHYSNLSGVQNIHELIIDDLEGWKTPLIIEIGNKEVNGKIFTHWKVKGTAHVFTIPTEAINQYGSHIDHLKQALETFRNDFKEWYEMGFSEKWMREYDFMFRNFILV